MKKILSLIIPNVFLIVSEMLLRIYLLVLQGNVFFIFTLKNKIVIVVQFNILHYFCSVMRHIMPTMTSI